LPKALVSFLDSLSRLLKSDEPAKLVARENAAVAVIFRENGTEAVLLIKRAVRPGDPWSGHVAFPGGRVSTTDKSFEETARRETLEEVGIDLSSPGASVFLGYLDALTPLTGSIVVVVPCVFKLVQKANVVLNNEASAHLWAPLRELATREARPPYRRSEGGREIDLPSFVHRDFTVWGLTERIISVIIGNAEDDGVGGGVG
jgi:8-oxo-dGTP pyrophosphatase MutT (NUDIX family)